MKESHIALDKPILNNDQPTQSDKLVAGVVKIGHSAPLPEIARVRTSIYRPHRNHKAQTVHRGHVASAPDLCQWDVPLSLNQAGIGARDGLRSEEIMPDPGQAVTGQGWDLGMDDRCQTNIAGLRQQHRAQREM